MDFATGAISSLLPKLEELCKEKYELSKGARKDIILLHSEMKILNAALIKVSEVPLDQLDSMHKLWASEVRELSYGLEDVIDTFLVNLEVSKSANPTDFLALVEKAAKTVKKLKTRREIADSIKDIRAQIRSVEERRERYKLDAAIAPYSASPTVDPRLMAMYQNRDIIGIEESSEDLIKKITRQDDNFSKQQLKILSIFGFTGLGKTTLAKVVYDKVKANFECWAFVQVGHQPDLKRTLKDLLFEVGAERYQDFSILNEMQLIDALRTQLHQKRYLIVVDDIWDRPTFNIILTALVANHNGSLVIVTTRIFEVAQIAGEVYKMKPLSHEKSEELFCNRLFGRKENIPDQLAEVTKSIIMKCGGIPLAIITMASLLAGKPWETWPELYNSVGFGHGDDGEVANTRKISLLSYYNLPSYLKSCLLHLSIFPEFYMIRKDTLIWKWIAEGFVRLEPGVGLFEVGERYFNELINKSLVQPVEIPHSGIIIGCHVNAIVLDMICVLSKEENLATVLDSCELGISDRPQTRPQTRRQTRRLAIQNSRIAEENEMLDNKYLRSFNVIKCEFQMMPSLTSFPLLRVLALEDCASIDGIYHLEHIRQLVQLRYLGLFNTPICELPDGIGNLLFLETLDLRRTKIGELPHGIVLLRTLKCLRAGSRTITVPDGMGNMVSLEELQLSDASNSCNIVKELGKLTELRNLKLCIRLSDERLKRDLVESLGNLQKIEILHLDGELWIEESYWEGYVPSLHLRHVSLGMKFSRLPAWINPLLLPKLSHLSLDVSVVEEEDLLILGSFPGLISLSLVGECVCLPDSMDGGAFPSLKYCYTSGMVRFLNGAAPILESVSFNIQLWGSKDGSSDLEFRSLLDHHLLQGVKIEIFYTEVHVMEVVKVEAALRKVLDIHPNSPILDISKWKSSVSEQFGSHYDIDANDYYDDNEEDNNHEYYYDEE